MAEAEQLLEALLSTHHDSSELHVLHGDVLRASARAEEARDAYVLAAHYEPHSPVPLVRHGLLSFEAGQFEEAIGILTEARSFDERNPLVENTLGAAYYQLGRLQSSLNHLRSAVALNPDFAEAHSNLGLLLFRDLEQFEEGALHLEIARELAPEDPAIACNWILVLKHRGQIEDALKECNALLASDATLDEVRLSRAILLLGSGDYARGWADYEARKRVRSNYAARTLPWREWSGDSLRGQTIYVHSEQGLGDQIMFASCLPDLIAQAGKCIFECHPKLLALFRHSFPQAVVVSPDEQDDANPQRGAPDFQVAMGTLPRFLRNEVEDFPKHDGYLSADPARFTHWRNALAGLPGRKKIGISWRGGARSTGQSLRSIDLSRWRDILSVRHCDFVSLQYSDCSAELSDMRQEGFQIHHWQDAIDDYSETAALVRALDLVVSVQTAVVHLAGALGTPVWVLIPAAAEWRYGFQGDAMPWYPSARLYRQRALHDWTPVIQKIACEIGRLVEDF